MKLFGSDNYSGVHLKVMEALVSANIEHVPAYGDDKYTAKLNSIFKSKFGEFCSTSLVYGGTGANIVALASILDSHQGVICDSISHINTDEGGAAEKLIGAKLLTCNTRNGKLTPEAIIERIPDPKDFHVVQPGAVSITQSTEFGLLYTQQEIIEISNVAKKFGLKLHMDGCRIYNAAASLGCSLKEITVDCGVDILTLGGTKNGLMFGEAILNFNPEIDRKLMYVHKQFTQLPSKARFIAAQFIALFTEDLWYDCAEKANSVAKYIESKVKLIKTIEVVKPVQTNMVFIKLNIDTFNKLSARSRFYCIDELEGIYRLVCSFDSSHEDVDKFFDDLS